MQSTPPGRQRTPRDTRPARSRPASSGRPQTATKTSRAIAVSLLLALVTAVALIVALNGGGGRRASARPGVGHAAVKAPAASKTPPAAKPSSFAVGLRVLTLTDSTRTLQLPEGRSEPRTLVTYVRYPAVGSASIADATNATPDRRDGPFPLVVFGHGFAVTPDLYKRLLQAWARAGYVVAAPLFPRENANAPGGPDESDLINQPADMSFVISRLLALAQQPADPFDGLVNAAHIAVSGHSDGGDTALAVTYNPSFRDPRIDAAVILSGAELPGSGPPAFTSGEPPLLATQGTADTVNLPSLTQEFFSAAQRPKYLLSLLGAEHIGPYSRQQPQLGIVEKVTTAFLDAYLKGDRAALRRLHSLGEVQSVASLVANP
jgi:dienelactone hydrolase